MRKPPQITPLSDHELVVARLNGDSVRILTGSQEGARFPLTMHFHLDDGYNSVEGQRPSRLASEYHKQFADVDRIARQMTGRGITHMWTSENGRNFIYLVGELFNPTMVWRRFGSGQGAQNQLLYNGAVHSVMGFVQAHNSADTFRVGEKVRITKEAALREIARIEKDWLRYYRDCLKRTRKADSKLMYVERVAECEQAIEMLYSAMKGKRKFKIRSMSNHVNESKRDYRLEVGEESIEVKFNEIMKALDSKAR